MVSVHDAGRVVAVGELVVFRQGLYDCVTARPDGLFELADALVCRPERVDSLPGLSLEPEFRRGHGSVYAALSEGRIDEDRLRRLLLATVPPGKDGVVWFAGDVSNWLRPDAVCSRERLVVQDKSARTVGGHPVSSGWPFAVLAALEWGPSSWTAPVDAVRLGPSDALTQTTLEMVERVRTGFTAADRAETLGFVFDAEYDLMALSYVVAGWAHIVGRLRKNQVFHAEPDPEPRRRGRKRRHGRRMKLNDPATLGKADRKITIDSPRYGKVVLSAWDNRHRRLYRDGYWAEHPVPLPIVAGSVIRIKVQRLSGKGGRPDGPMWLWHAGPTMLDLETIFSVYQRRFDLEHTFRFFKQDLGWTVPAPMNPETAERWTWLALAVYTQLRLARRICRDMRMRWEKPADPDRIPPRRVRRDFRRLRTLVGTPANPPKFSRPGPGRPKGSTRPPHDRHPTHHKHSRTNRKRRKTKTKIKPKG